jgi:hypothetical protein
MILFCNTNCSILDPDIVFGEGSLKNCSLKIRSEKLHKVFSVIVTVGCSNCSCGMVMLACYKHILLVHFQYSYTMYIFIFNTGLVEALCYKPEGRGFDSRWCHWNFSLM